MAISAAARQRVVAALRAAGCVYAEEEAELLLTAATDDAALEALVRRRQAGEPLEHLVGGVRFGDLDLVVGPGAFVPRQRTLFLAERVVGECLRRESPTMLEACCGVAPLAATVERAGVAREVVAVDHNERALTYARRNLRDADVYAGDLSDALPARLAGHIDVLAAVPPYVPDGEAELLPREARDHEPPGALFGGTDGLEVIRRLLADTPPWLTPGAAVLLEMHVGQAPTAAAEARALGYIARWDTAPDEQTAVLRAVRA